MLTYDHFSVAYGFFAVAGAWAIIYFQLSDLLNKKASELQKYRSKLERRPNQYKASVAYRKALRSYRLFKLGGTFVLIVITGSCLYWTSQSKAESEQKDVYAKLVIQPFIPPSGNVLRTGITVTNGGRVDIKDDHTIRCYLRRIVYAPYGGITNILMQTTLPEKAPWRAYGGGETSYCIVGIQSFPPDTHAICADITVTVFYALETQPAVKKTKQLRFAAVGEDFSYHQQPVDYPGDYCPEPRLPPQPPFH